MALEIGPWTGESLPLVIPVTNAKTGEAIDNPSEVRIWVTRPNGTVLGDKKKSLGEVEHLGDTDPADEGRFRAVFVPDAKGMHVARSTVVGPDGLSKSSKLSFQVHQL